MKLIKLKFLLIFLACIVHETGCAQDNNYRVRQIFKNRYYFKSSIVRNQELKYFYLKPKNNPEFKVKTKTYTDLDNHTVIKRDTIWIEYDTIAYELPRKVIGNVIENTDNTLKVKFIGFRYWGNHIETIKRKGETISVDTSLTYIVKKKIANYEKGENFTKVKIPLKSFRLAATSIPSSLTTNIFNGALSFSWRYGSTHYYIKNPHEPNRTYFIEGGFFLGLTKIAFAENNNTKGYDDLTQLALSFGGLTSFSLNKINFSIAGGWDVGTSYQSKFWANDRKFWLGLGIGVDLGKFFKGVNGY